MIVHLKMPQGGVSPFIVTMIIIMTINWMRLKEFTVSFPVVGTYRSEKQMSPSCGHVCDDADGDCDDGDNDDDDDNGGGGNDDDGDGGGD